MVPTLSVLEPGDIANIVNWIPTYNHVYQCSPRLLPFDGTPDELNDDLDIYRTQPYEFWIAKLVIRIGLMSIIMRRR